MIDFQNIYTPGMKMNATDVRKAAETASAIHHNPATHRLINRFLLHSPETSKIYYEQNDLAQSIQATHELARLATLLRNASASAEQQSICVEPLSSVQSVSEVEEDCEVECRSNRVIFFLSRFNQSFIIRLL
jgi:hypothetical protein